MAALSQSCLLETKSRNGVLQNQELARLNFPVFGDLRQSLVWSVTSAIGASARVDADEHRGVFYSITRTIPATSG